MAVEKEETCCSEFNPSQWDEKEIVWQNKKFLQDRVRSLMHIPLNFGAVMKRDMTKILTAGAQTEPTVLLSDEESPWDANIFINVTKDVPDSKMTTISGTFLSKVFEGPYKNIRTWIDQMHAFVKSKGKQVRKLYFYYTTCPKCAKKYGKNYVVLLTQI